MEQFFEMYFFEGAIPKMYVFKGATLKVYFLREQF